MNGNLKVKQQNSKKGKKGEKMKARGKVGNKKYPSGKKTAHGKYLRLGIDFDNI